MQKGPPFICREGVHARCTDMYAANVCIQMRLHCHANSLTVCLRVQVLIMVPATDANLSIYAAWVATGARDRGLLLLDGLEHGAAGAVRMQVRKIAASI